MNEHFVSAAHSCRARCYLQTAIGRRNADAHAATVPATSRNHIRFSCAARRRTFRCAFLQGSARRRLARERSLPQRCSCRAACRIALSRVTTRSVAFHRFALPRDIEPGLHGTASNRTRLCRLRMAEEGREMDSGSDRQADERKCVPRDLSLESSDWCLRIPSEAVLSGKPSTASVQRSSLRDWQSQA